jgi:putative endonuclease
MKDLTKNAHLVKGHEIEKLAAEYLVDQGIKLLQRNFRSRLGEIDLIGVDQNQLIFVEVRFRRYSDYGSAADSVNYKKQQKLIRTARYFLHIHPQYANLACRFDVIAVTLVNNEPNLEWIQNAFC